MQKRVDATKKMLHVQLSTKKTRALFFVFLFFNMLQLAVQYIDSYTGRPGSSSG